MSLPPTSVCLDDVQAGRSVQALGGRVEIERTQGQDTPFNSARPASSRAPQSTVLRAAPPPLAFAPAPGATRATLVNVKTRTVRATAGIADGTPWRVVVIAFCAFIGVAAVPFLGALAMLFDRNYTFWAGYFYPVLLMSVIIVMGIALIMTFATLHKYGRPQFYEEQTLVTIACIYTALLGIVLVLVSLPQSKELYEAASHIGHGCSSSNAKMNYLTDYSQVLYQIRAQPSCRGEDSVAQCQGWESNRYTQYLEHLETEFQCGPVCADVPIGDSRRRTQTAGDGEGGNFLQVRAGNAGQHHRQLAELSTSALQAADKLSASLSSLWAPADDGVRESMWLASPQQGRAIKLFSQGNTRTSCSALIATRLQVLAWCFGDVMFWEGLGLMTVSLMLSFFSFMEQCLRGKKG